MRRKFVEFLTKEVDKNPNIILITADLGYGLFDAFKERFPNNFINCGAAEQLMMGLCIGAAYEGKIPVAYSITPFLLYRPFELIRNYINKEKLNIKLVGSGRGKDYAHDGFSHWAEDDEQIITNSFENILCLWPTMDNIDDILTLSFHQKHPCYINLSR